MDDHIEGYAMIVDMNQFTSMVSRAEETGDAIAQFTSDVLAGAIAEIEAEGGEVVAFMGDAVLGYFPEGDGALLSCFGIAKDLDRQCEYVSNEQDENDYSWPFSPGGPSLSIAVEYGTMDISTIGSRLLGEHRLLIGTPINHAARISEAGEGNRCVIGPVAATKAFRDFNIDGPHFISGKKGEPDYDYHLFELGDIWIEGQKAAGKDTYWG